MRLYGLKQFRYRQSATESASRRPVCVKTVTSDAPVISHVRPWSTRPRQFACRVHPKFRYDVSYRYATLVSFCPVVCTKRCVTDSCALTLQWDDTAMKKSM
jgi:hypothetical protein